MLDFLRNLFTSDFMPHGYCYKWDLSVVRMHVVSDALIALAYYSIPITLAYFVRKRRDLPFSWMFIMFAGFIVACGSTHLMEIWNVWNGTYRLAGVIKVITAGLSVATAFLLVRLIPVALTLRSPAELIRLNADLEHQVAERRRAEEELRLSGEELERRVAERTQALARTNAALEAGLAERRAAEEELQASRAQFRATFEQAAVGLAHVALDGRWLRVNRRLCSIVDYSEEELLRRSFQDMTHPEDLESDLGQVRRMLAGEIETYQLEKRYLRKDSSVVWINLTASIVRDVAGTPQYFIAVVEDITLRKQADAQLRSSLKEVSELKAALDEHAIVATTDPQGKITYVNDKFCSISKYSREELLGQDHRLINSGHHSKEFIRALWTTIAQGHVWKGEIKNRAKDGSYYWVDTTIVPFLNERGKPFQYVAIRADITERKRAEERAAWLASFPERNPNPIVELDLDQAVIHYANPMASRVFPDLLARGIDHPLLAGLSSLASSLISGEAEASRREIAAGEFFFAQTITYDREVRRLRVYSSDITDRKQADDRLKASFKEIGDLKSALDEHAIVAITDPQGKITYVNDKFCDISKYSREELIGQDHRLINSGHHSKDFIRDLWTTIARGGVWHGEIKNRAKDGSFYWVDTTIVPFLNEQGKPRQYVAIRADITERKRGEEAIIDSLHEKETLLKEIHHRVKNNMQLISSLLQLQSGYIRDPGALAIFRDGQSRIRSMALIHEKLYQSPSLARIDFSEYVRSLIALLMRSYNARPDRVSVELRIDSIWLNLDTAIPFGLILNELVSNSLKHAFPDDRRGVIQITLGQLPDAWIELVVKDNGVGMAGSFDWTKSASLGSRLVRILADQLQGRPNLVTRDGVEFRLTFKEVKAKNTQPLTPTL